jgi:cell division protein FtsI (penicillin-binding protein 3)
MTKPANRWSKVSIGAISMGQEISVSAVQLAAMVSIIGYGVLVAPRIVAGQLDPQSAPQPIAFHPANERRVISPLTAAQMRRMLQEVVLHGTGPKALLEGYSSAGKTGTAQKIDPSTGAYSHTKYVASFAGFAPVNNPAVTVAVILDSAQGLHQGGQIAAPVFQRITQHVLEYLHVPHDVELPASRQMLLARQRVTNDQLDESSPDHLGTSLEIADSQAAEPAQPPVTVKPSATIASQVVPASLKEREPLVAPAVKTPAVQDIETPVPLHSSGTVVLMSSGASRVPLLQGSRSRCHQRQRKKLDWRSTRLKRLRTRPVAACRLSRGYWIAHRGPFRSLRAEQFMCPIISSHP